MGEILLDIVWYGSLLGCIPGVFLVGWLINDVRQERAKRRAARDGPTEADQPKKTSASA